MGCGRAAEPSIGWSAPVSCGSRQCSAAKCRSDQINQDTAAQAYVNLLKLRIRLYPYAPFTERIWELRANLFAYDAWYVSIAELLDAELAQLACQWLRATGHPGLHRHGMKGLE